MLKPGAEEEIKSPDSLSFLTGTLAVHVALSSAWVFADIPHWSQFLGLISSFVLISFLAKLVWQRRLDHYERELHKQGKTKTGEQQRPLRSMSHFLQNFIVENLRFAVFSFDKTLLVKQETPILPKELFEEAILDDRDLIDMLSLSTKLSKDELQLLRFQLQHSFGMDRIQWTSTAVSLPPDAGLKKSPNRFVRLSYIPSFEDEKLAKVHLIIQDISEIKEREVKAEQQRKDMEKFFDLLQVSDSLFELFMSETRKLFEDIKYDLKSLREKSGAPAIDTANRMFRAVHTIKANAKLFKLTSIQDVAHGVENYLEELRAGRRSFNPQVLAELTQKIMAISEEVYSYASLRKEILNTADRNTGFNLKYRVQWIRSLMNQFASILRDPKFEQRHLKLIQKEFSRALSSFDKASLREYIAGYQQMVTDIAASLGKADINIVTDLECHHFDSATLGRINDILLHCIRNAADHGIESPEERQSQGKPASGTIRLHTKEQDNMTLIEVSDDGRGLDIEKIKKKAVEMHIVGAEEAAKMTEKEAIPLLYHSGVSTSAEITPISGRGLGMDVVRDYVQTLNGNLNISFEKGKGTLISIWVPASNEDFVTPLGIYDLHEIVDEVLREYLHYAADRFLIEYTNQGRITIFSDKLSLIEILRVILTELNARCPAQAKVSLKVEEHLGRRRVDSFAFYRINASYSIAGQVREIGFDQESKVVETASSLLRKNGGSLYLRSAQQLEINIPSNIPVRFAEYEFKVIVISDRLQELPVHIASFFQQVMAGWTYELLCFPDDKVKMEELSGHPCLVLLDSTKVKEYISIRDENDRKKDGVVLFPEEELDIDTLNGSSILPENILFVPPSFDEKHFHRCLAGVIFRRFLKEMVRDQSGMSYRDRDRLVRGAS